MGELLKQMRESGERTTGAGARELRGATLGELGIPRDRASRAMQLADVPEEEFEAARFSARAARRQSLRRSVGPRSLGGDAHRVRRARAGRYRASPRR